MKIFNLVSASLFLLAIATAASLDGVAKSIERRAERQIPMQRSTEASEELSSVLRESGSMNPGGVVVQALFLNQLQEIVDDFLLFQIVFDSVDVDMADFDISKNAVVEDSAGRRVEAGITWRPIHELGYHKMGILIAPGWSREDLLSEDTAWIQLSIKGIPAEQTRTFIWLLG
jgi:hypothetical protein